MRTADDPDLPGPDAAAPSLNIDVTGVRSLPMEVSSLRVTPHIGQ